MFKIITTMLVVLILFGCSAQDTANSVDRSASPGSSNSVNKPSPPADLKSVDNSEQADDADSVDESDSADKLGSVDCPIPGELIDWQAAYCMFQEETDDFENEAVQKCHSERTAVDKKSSETDCQRKKFYKQTYCKILVDNGYFKGTVTECMSAKDEMPRSVKDKGFS